MVLQVGECNSILYWQGGLLLVSKRVDIVRVVNFSNLSQLLKKRPSITKRKESGIYSGISAIGILNDCGKSDYIRFMFIFAVFPIDIR